jgi:hypothetical protein
MIKRRFIIMIRKRNFTKIIIFALICSVVLITFPSLLYAAWPNITLNPTTASIGGALTITTTTGFEAARGTGKVTFAGSGDTTTVTSWSDTQIVLNVPAGTTTGNVTVTENTGVSASAPAALTVVYPGRVSQETVSTEIVIQEPEPEPEPDPWEITDTGFYEKTDTGFATLFYSRFFRRAPEQAGLDSWVARLQNGDITGADLVNGFIFGEENQAKISDYTNSEFILFLYKVLFDREPGDDGYNAWLSIMNAGMTREEVVIGFTHSTEFVSLCNQFGIIPYPGYIGE